MIAHIVIIVEAIQVDVALVEMVINQIIIYLIISHFMINIGIRGITLDGGR